AASAIVQVIAVGVVLSSTMNTIDSPNPGVVPIDTSRLANVPSGTGAPRGSRPDPSMPKPLPGAMTITVAFVKRDEVFGPVGPVAPVAPVAPVGPAGPVRPVSPVGPVGPITPVAPVAPVG